MPSGGWITIETTEALTAIDVNSGRFTQSGGLEETSLAVNLEAAREIGRQIRLRGIGGLIVVDFIHLRDADHAREVLAALEQSLAFDRAPVQISPMSEFGIVAITRKRVREPLARLTGVPAPPAAARAAPIAGKRGAGVAAPGGARSPRQRRAGKSWPRPRRMWRTG